MSRSVQSQAGCVLLLSQHQGAQSVPQCGLPQCGGVQPGTRIQRSGEVFLMRQGLGFGLGLDNNFLRLLLILVNNPTPTGMALKAVCTIMT